VDTDGFYRLLLTSEITGLLSDRFADLRISDQEGRMVPYLIAGDISKQSAFVAFPILKNETDTAGNTILELENNYPDRKIDRLTIQIKNAAVARAVRISGSNDQKNWYIIKEHMLTDLVVNNEGDSYSQSLLFPPSRYQYFRLLVSNNQSDPLNILQAGTQYTAPGSHGKDYVQNPPARFTQTDSSDGKTYLFIYQNMPYSVDRLELGVSHPALYSREATVYSGTKAQEYLSSFVIRSDDPVAGYPLSTREKSFVIVIENGDNPPLKVASVNLFAQKQYLFCFLQRGYSYKLLLGDSTLQAPSYDIKSFFESMSMNNAEIKYTGIVPIESKVEEKKPDSKDSKLLWAMIITSIALLGWFSFRLLKDMGKAKDNS